MAAEVVGVELDVANGDLGLVGVHSGVGLREAVLLQHVEQCSLARVVQSEKDYVG